MKEVRQVSMVPGLELRNHRIIEAHSTRTHSRLLDGGGE